MTLAALVLAFVTLQRLGELVLARRNTAALLARGGREVGAEHYPLIVALDSKARRDFQIHVDELRLQHRCTDVGDGQCQPPSSAEAQWTFPMP